MNVNAKKHLGQHFLKDENIAKKIADNLTELGYSEILEIGPGTGVLTKYLLTKKHKTTVIELDRESVLYLKEIFVFQHLNKYSKTIKIIEGDFLKQNIKALFKKKQIAIIGNFPYNISSQIIFKTIENRHFIPELIGMFQKEVAQRITQNEGSKIYGIISVLTQAFYDTEYLFSVPPSVFNPPPKVDSGVIRLKRKKKYSLPINEDFFFKVVKTAFNQRRKMLRSSLKCFELVNSLKQDPIFAKRPEELSVNEFIEIARRISTKNKII